MNDGGPGLRGQVFAISCILRQCLLKRSFLVTSVEHPWHRFSGIRLRANFLLGKLVLSRLILLFMNLGSPGRWI